jgi:hypothetical protein
MTIGGSPQLWQQLSNLVSAVQHKAQIKFLSMVLSPQADSDAVEESPSAQAEQFSSCKASAFGQTQDETQAKPDSSSRKRKAERRTAVSSEEQEALALADVVKEKGKPPLTHLHSPQQEAQNLLAMHAVDFTATASATDRSSVVEVVVLPRIDSAAPAFIDNGNILKLKKTFEETKALRQKAHYFISRPIQPLPPTKMDAVSSEREG